MNRSDDPDLLEQYQKELLLFGAISTSKNNIRPTLEAQVHAVDSTGSRRFSGFVKEEVTGRLPNVGDLKDCRDAVQDLQNSVGYLYGNVSRANFRVNGEGAAKVAMLTDFTSAIPLNTLPETER